MANGGAARSGDQPQELQDLKKEWEKKFDLAERTQKVYRDRWDTYYGLYRNYRRLNQQARVGRSERDRDAVILNAQREWGAELFIPYAFAVIETIVPRVISNDPKMLVLPRNEDSKPAAQRVQELLDVQQKDISYDLKLQSVARAGLKYGLGVQKTFWEKKTRKINRNQPRKILPGLQTVETEVVLREGPQVEPVDIWDFFWDPAARDVETAAYLIHRTWRTQEYVKSMVDKGTWLPLDMEAVKGLATDKARGDVWAGRQAAAGIDKYDTSRGNLHEVWECHNGERVVTVLDRELVVQNEVTPFFHREMPFQIFRPTIQEQEFVGIGEIEPITHLQFELNTLRSQRRDNATLVLQKSFLYADGFVDPEDLKIGPGKGIAIRGTDIRSVIQPLDFGDIAASGYREEDSIKGDIERTTGISEALSAGSGDGTPGSDTATGIQLVQAAAGVRIKLKTKNLLAETVRPAGRQFLELDRQYIQKATQIRVPDSQVADGFKFTEVGPLELLADLDPPIPDAGSTEPDNPPARQQSAMSLYEALSQDRNVNQQELVKHLLKEYDIPNTDAFMVPLGQVPINPTLLGQALEQAGIPSQVVVAALDQALSQSTGTPPVEPGNQGGSGLNGAQPPPPAGPAPPPTPPNQAQPPGPGQQGVANNNAKQ